uniref:Endonuclease/exonuclease/phosphatase domain-containing protein n=1 Tax=Latimeria chalumnae TaxID=7897 RepID=H3B1G0_LATCH
GWGTCSRGFTPPSPRGPAILIDKNSPFLCLSQITDPAGQFIIVHGKWGSRLVTLASMYAPNIDDPVTVQTFFLKLAQFPYPWIIGRDFNCPLDTIVDRSSPILVGQTQMARVIRASMAEYGLVDTWRHLHPKTREYSPYSHAHDSFSRIDLILVSASLIHQVKERKSLPRYISDHSPISIQMVTSEEGKGPYRWRLDSQLLTKKESVKEIELAINEFFRFNHPLVSTPDMIWEAFKVTIRGKIIALSSAYKKAYRQRTVSLELDLRRAETELYKSNSAENRERVASLQHELNVLSTPKAERALHRTRSRFYARRDKAGKLLAWQLRREEADRHIPSITLEDGTTSSTPGAINRTFQNYYTSLYSTQYDRGSMREYMFSFLEGVEIPGYKINWEKCEAL